MKKLSVIIAIIGMTSLAASSAFAATAAGSAFTKTAAAITGAKDAGGTEQALGTLSNKVSINVNWSTTAFAAATRHESGTKSFGSSSADTKIYSTDSTSLAAPGASDASAFSSWTAM